MKYLKKFNESIGETPEFSVRLVQGEDIRKYYNSDYYAAGPRGTGLENSREKFLDMMVLNPGVCKLAIVWAPDDTIRARALVWKINPIGDGEFTQVMDKIYGIYGSSERALMSWARGRGIPYKNLNWENFIFRDKEIDIQAQVSLEHIPQKFPRMDSFALLDPDTKTLENVPNKVLYNMEYPQHIGKWILKKDDGGYIPYTPKISTPQKGEDEIYLDPQKYMEIILREAAVKGENTRATRVDIHRWVDYYLSHGDSSKREKGLEGLRNNPYLGWYWKKG